MHGAGAALAVVAAFLGAGQADVLAQGVEQRGAHVESELMTLTIDANADLRGTSAFGRGLRRRPRSGAFQKRH